MADEIEGLKVTVLFDSSQVTEGVSKTTAQMKKISESASKSTSVFSNLKTTLLGVFGGNVLYQGMQDLKTGLEDSIKAAENTQQAYSRLNTVMKATGVGSASAEKAMRETAEASTNFGFKISDTASALGTLIAATHNTVDSQHLLGTAMDYARFKGMDLGTAASIMARATQGSAKAFHELGITLDTSLPKQKAINKAMNEFQATVKGQAAAYMKTFAGQMSFLSANFEKLSADIGDILIPVIMDVIGFFKSFGNEIIIIGGIILGSIALFKAYQIAMNVWKFATIAYALATKGLAEAQEVLLASAETTKAGQEGLAAAQATLNAVMNANPIMLVVIALIALAAALLIAWNHSKIVRDGIIDMAKLSIEAIGWIVGAVGLLVKAFLEFETGPLKLLLKGLSFLPGIGGPAKAALKIIGDATKDVGNFFDDGKKKIDNFAGSLDSLKNKKIELPGLGGGKTTATSLNDTSAYNLHNYTGSTKTSKAKSTKTKHASIKAQERGIVHYTIVNVDGTKAATQKILYGGQ